MKYLNKFNVRRLQQMFTNINLIKICLKKNACLICAKVRMKIKVYKNFICLSCYVNKWIHNDLIKLFEFNIYKIKYYINFLNTDLKILEKNF